MTLLLDLAIRSSVVLAAGLLLDALLRSRAAALRHVVLALSVLAAVVVAPLSLTVPAWEVTMPQRATPAPAGVPSAATDSPAVPAISSAISAATVTTAPVAEQTPVPFVLLLWLAGWLTAGSARLVAVRRLSRIAGRGTLVEDERWLESATEIAHAYGTTENTAVATAKYRRAAIPEE